MNSSTRISLVLLFLYCQVLVLDSFHSLHLHLHSTFILWALVSFNCISKKSCFRFKKTNSPYYFWPTSPLYLCLSPSDYRTLSSINWIRKSKISKGHNFHFYLYEARKLCDFCRRETTSLINERRLTMYLINKYQMDAYGYGFGFDLWKFWVFMFLM